jgi:hypothetical protein
MQNTTEKFPTTTWSDNSPNMQMNLWVFSLLSREAHSFPAYLNNLVGTNKHDDPSAGLVQL